MCCCCCDGRFYISDVYNFWFWWIFVLCFVHMCVGGTAILVASYQRRRTYEHTGIDMCSAVLGISEALEEKEMDVNSEKRVINVGHAGQRVQTVRRFTGTVRSESYDRMVLR